MEEGAPKAITGAVESIQIREIGRMTRDYLNSGNSGDRLLVELGLTILKDDNGWSLMNTLRTVFDEWERCAGHPARGQLLVGLARWATDGPPQHRIAVSCPDGAAFRPRGNRGRVVRMNSPPGGPRVDTLLRPASTVF